MDDFGIERPELRGTLLSLEFGPGGRIHQLWAADPALPETSDEFQFVLGPVSFGEEFSEDYFPGTILLGARLRPDEPWIVSRNSGIDFRDTDDEENVVRIDYDFPLLPEVAANARFHEIPGTIPVVAWDLTLSNQGRTSLEIGELGFPFAFYNLMQGATRDEQGGRNPYQDRVYIHKFIGGAASYLHAQRRSSEAPGLLIFPGGDTSWEMCAHVPRSLASHYHWEGIPVVYVYSRATIEREGWAAHPGEHTSLILEPGDSRLFRTCFVPTSNQLGDAIFETLAACRRPTMRVLPAAVAPAAVGIAVEVGGVTPTRFFVSKEAEIETDSDENGGFCFVKPKGPGVVRLSFEDTERNLSHAHLLFTEPIADLIQKRARWIVEHQFHDEPDSALHHGILLSNIRTHESVASIDDYAFPFAIESGLCDALFLAEKNVHFPLESEVKVLETMVDDYLLDDIHNVSDGTVGCVFADFKSVALNSSRPRIYPIVFNFYDSMYRLGRKYGITKRPPEQYLGFAAQVAMTFFRSALKLDPGGMPGYSRIFDIVGDLHEAGWTEMAEELREQIANRARRVLRYPVSGNEDMTGDAARFEEMFWSARVLGESTTEELALNHAFASRDLGPSWWSYASDYRVLHEQDGVPTEFTVDKGQLMLGHSTIANSLMYLDALDEDLMIVDDPRLRLAFGGLLGPWALIRPDGAASMAFCPDPASKQFGASPLTGDIGMALFYYLRRVRALVLPSRNHGVFTFGCHFEVEADHYVVQPWDGIQQRIILSQIGCDVLIDAGQIQELRLDLRKRWMRLAIRNSTIYDVSPSLVVRGLWGAIFRIGDVSVGVEGGYLQHRFTIPQGQTIELEVKVEQ